MARRRSSQPLACRMPGTAQERRNPCDPDRKRTAGRPISCRSRWVSAPQQSQAGSGKPQFPRLGRLVREICVAVRHTYHNPAVTLGIPGKVSAPRAPGSTLRRKPESVRRNPLIASGRSSKASDRFLTAAERFRPDAKQHHIDCWGKFVLFPVLKEMAREACPANVSRFSHRGHSLIQSIRASPESKRNAVLTGHYGRAAYSPTPKQCEIFRRQGMLRAMSHRGRHTAREN